MSSPHFTCLQLCTLKKQVRREGVPSLYHSKSGRSLLGSAIQKCSLPPCNAEKERSHGGQTASSRRIACTAEDTNSSNIILAKSGLFSYFLLQTFLKPADSHAMFVLCRLLDKDL